MQIQFRRSGRVESQSGGSGGIKILRPAADAWLFAAIPVAKRCR